MLRKEDIAVGGSIYDLPDKLWVIHFPQVPVLNRRSLFVEHTNGNGRMVTILHFEYDA